MKMFQQRHPAGTVQIAAEGQRIDMAPFVEYGGEVSREGCRFVEGHRRFSASTRDRFFNRGDIYWEANMFYDAGVVDDEVRHRGNVTNELQRRRLAGRTLEDDMRELNYATRLNDSDPAKAVRMYEGLRQSQHPEVRALGAVRLSYDRAASVITRIGHAQQALAELHTLNLEQHPYFHQWIPRTANQMLDLINHLHAVPQMPAV